MKRRHASMGISALALCTAVVLFTCGAPAHAADSTREETWQFYVPLTYLSGETIGGQGGSSVKLNNDLGWGFAFGYNLNERFSIGFEITWINVNYNATIQEDTNMDGMPDSTVSVGGTLDASSLQFAGQYNFLEKTVTPFIRASLGSTYVDSNIPSGPPQGTCWWDPWWGYVCGNWVPTYDANNFSYAAGLGVRADVGDAFYLELSYNQLWIDFSNDTPSFNGGRLNIGWAFD